MNLGKGMNLGAGMYLGAGKDLGGGMNTLYPSKTGGLSRSDKRKLIVRWVSAAWEEMKRERQHCIKSAFVDTGILIAKDGSENNLITLWTKSETGMYGF